MNLKDRIKQIAATHLTNKEIASTIGCSERSARRYAGAWKDRVLSKRTIHDTTGMDRKAFLLCDTHIPYNNQKVLDIALDYGAQWEPDEVIIAGDWVDFKDVSSWKNDPNRLSFKEEIDQCKRSLSILRSRFPSQKIVYIEGNHEFRLTRYLWSKAPELSQLPELIPSSLLSLQDFGIEYVSNVSLMNAGLEPYSIGKLYVLHGHEVPMAWGGVNLARTMYLKTHVNVIFGHYHQSQHFIFKKLDNTHEGSWMVGCLCKLSESYSPANNWVNGLATVKYNTLTGNFKVRNKIILDGQIY